MPRRPRREEPNWDREDEGCAFTAHDLRKRRTEATEIQLFPNRLKGRFFDGPVEEEARPTQRGPLRTEDRLEVEVEERRMHAVDSP